MKTKRPTKEQFTAELAFDTDPNELGLKSGDKIYSTDDPSLFMVLHILHGHELIGHGYFEGYHNTHFHFKYQDCIEEHVARWDEVASDDVPGYLNLFLYMAALLGDYEKEGLETLLQDLQSFDPKVHK